MHKGEIQMYKSGTGGRSTVGANFVHSVDAAQLRAIGRQYPHMNSDVNNDPDDTVYNAVAKGRKDKLRDRRARKGYTNE